MPGKSKIGKARTEKYGRWYPIEQDDGSLVDYVSVTTFLDAIAKKALLNWIGKVERELCVTASADLYEEQLQCSAAKCHNTERMSRAAYTSTLLKHVGKERASDKLKNKAADIGTEVHDHIEWTLRDELGIKQRKQRNELTTDASRIAWNGWLEWRKKVKLKPIAIEQQVYSDRYQYAGTLDLLAWLTDPEVFGHDEPVLCCLDWKTGKAVYPEALLQNVAYREALVEMKQAEQGKVAGYIVLLPKIQTDKGFEAVPVPLSLHDELLRVVIGVLFLWQYLQLKDRERREAWAVKTAERRAMRERETKPITDPRADHDSPVAREKAAQAISSEVRTGEADRAGVQTGADTSGSGTASEPSKGKSQGSSSGKAGTEPSSKAASSEQTGKGKPSSKQVIVRIARMEGECSACDEKILKGQEYVPHGNKRRHKVHVKAAEGVEVSLPKGRTGSRQQLRDELTVAAEAAGLSQSDLEQRWGAVDSLTPLVLKQIIAQAGKVQSGEVTREAFINGDMI